MDDWLDFHLSITQIGLFYDLAGAYVLAWGFLVISPRDFRNATLFWRGKPEVEQLGCAKVDALFGVTLIALGFFGQLLGTSKTFNLWFERAGAIASASLAGILLLVVICFFIFRRSLVEKVILGSDINNEDL